MTNPPPSGPTTREEPPPRVWALGPQRSGGQDNSSGACLSSHTSRDNGMRSSVDNSVVTRTTLTREDREKGKRYITTTVTSVTTTRILLPDVDPATGYVMIKDGSSSPPVLRVVPPTTEVTVEGPLVRPSCPLLKEHSVVIDGGDKPEDHSKEEIQPLNDRHDTTHAVPSGSKPPRAGQVLPPSPLGSQPSHPPRAYLGHPPRLEDLGLQSYFRDRVGSSDPGRSGENPAGRAGESGSERRWHQQPHFSDGASVERETPVSAVLHEVREQIGQGFYTTW